MLELQIASGAVTRCECVKPDRSCAPKDHSRRRVALVTAIAITTPLQVRRAGPKVKALTSTMHLGVVVVGACCVPWIERHHAPKPAPALDQHTLCNDDFRR